MRDTKYEVIKKLREENKVLKEDSKILRGYVEHLLRNDKKGGANNGR